MIVAPTHFHTNHTIQPKNTMKIYPYGRVDNRENTFRNSLRKNGPSRVIVHLTIRIPKWVQRFGKAMRG